MMNDRTVLIVIGVLIILLMGSILFVTHQPVPQMGNQASTTVPVATTTTSGGTTTKTGIPATSGTHGSASGSGTGSKPTVHPGTPAAAPHITKFLPAAGTTGTSVTIVGSGFSSTGNHIYFGPSDSRFHADGTPANQIDVADSTDGTTLTFTVPSSGPSGLLCDSSGCVAVSAVAITPGTYPVTVSNAAGTSNTVSYIVIK